MKNNATKEKLNKEVKALISKLEKVMDKAEEEGLMVYPLDNAVDALYDWTLTKESF